MHSVPAIQSWETFTRAKVACAPEAAVRPVFLVSSNPRRQASNAAFLRRSDHTIRVAISRTNAP
ncbi:hypothetical protein D777_00598 [Marinobacter nitratireducens]|uniref:Uncharacterized protein n=1 Tax=Marinobacter nitratireducens TaxID=1137280 RepID=A0A072N2P9_9GAMM|nr:hypothetical protein D777_00598 [Marinobacter nitratireducens]